LRIIDGYSKTATESSVGTQACQPEYDHEEIEGQYSPRIVA
jgi:hypothetical protein